jgi:4-amino-4-deoxy-L-arabinose transferase-like glycosyltransferase
VADFFFKEVLPEYLVDIPLHLVCLVGIILALVFYRRHPAVSLLMLCALALVILLGLIGPWTILMAQNKARAGWSVESIESLINLIRVGYRIFNMAAYGLLLLAVFGWRRRAPEEEFATGVIKRVSEPRNW